ncbi:class I SAM-dependent DNA methyltransferase [Rhizobium tubonense]|uniref:SAM-dependent methyltransferase n=1 Tax=Rhizobium tubonense TaxID=484088 RepID=A0A2W4EMM7_9HYPH|nr:methyltransferase [Rhizobium tubonense]PZM12060.1 SAM-dependent methyltransferase [Rhizobium tubonense]
MLPSQLSSGDATADRRADYAKMLAESGEPASAAELMEQALEVVPEWAAGWFGLANYRDKAGNAKGATEALHHLLALDADDMFGAGLKLALLGAIDVPDQPPSRYIERMFDDYAERFDKSLIEKLGYAAPRKLAELIAETAGISRHFRLAVDLGCGTGLLGTELSDRVERFEGFDLSRKMLAKAAEKRVYQHLGQADLSLPAPISGLFGQDLAAHRADLIAAADVFIYLGNLETVFANVRELAAPGAIFAFSVEDAGAGEGTRLGPSLRYAHSQDYVIAICHRYGMAIETSRRTVIRMDAGKPVHGILFLTRAAA